ncbi:anthrone oxygenase family protein [Pseudonocardia humida]|uniref:DUF1772 domain-containing protein n=1 Tax=Pseudonocardia humida TaxID=2800819 RepID=A0ABT1A2R8_9PSEU|nr:anthrone oxygenase family protein [Pseudonocardia humida]MCO1657300.1 DUF1772 domain-containing protein [Pseudonocardia humida]
MSALGPVASLVAGVGCAAVGGAFFTFSTFTMQGLTRLPDEAGAEAMRSINRTAPRPPFMALLFGSAAAAAAVAVADLVSGARTAPLTVSGAALYLVGTIGVTMAGNVPLNNALEAERGRPTRLWRDYAHRWTRLNHVRTVTSLAAGALLALAA